VTGVQTCALPIYPVPAPLQGLCAASAGLFPAFAAELRRDSDLDVEYRVTGALALQGGEIETPGELEPVLAPDLRGGALLPDAAQVRAKRIAPALAQAAAGLGVEFRPHSDAVGFLRVPGRVTGVKTSRGDVRAGETVVAAGAWSAELLATIDVHVDVRPVRGQIASLDGPPDLIRRIILWNDHYIVPRADGRIVLGTTFEDAGFDKRVTAAGVAGILSDALRVAPGLSPLPMIGTWAGLRPATADELPYVGRPPGIQGLVVATGHHRNGILLAPITARLIVDILAGRPPAIDPTPFRLDRKEPISK
jgi:glycine oxidase